MHAVPFNPLLATLHVTFETLRHDNFPWAEEYLRTTMAAPEQYTPYCTIMNVMAYHTAKNLEKNPSITARSLMMAALQRNIQHPVYQALVQVNHVNQKTLEEEIDHWQENAPQHGDAIYARMQNRDFSAELFANPPNMNSTDFDALLNSADETDCYLKDRRDIRNGFLPASHQNLPALSKKGIPYDPVTTALHLGLKMAEAEILPTRLNVKKVLKNIIGPIDSVDIHIPIIVGLAESYLCDLLEKPELTARGVMFDTLERRRNTPGHGIVQRFQTQHQNKLRATLAFMHCSQRGSVTQYTYQRHLNVTQGLFDKDNLPVSSAYFDNLCDLASGIDRALTDPAIRQRLQPPYPGN